MSKSPPSSVTIRFCPICGRNDRYVPFTGKAHFSGGAKCPGAVIAITYETRASL